MAIVLPLVATGAHDIHMGDDIPSGGHDIALVARGMAMDDHGLSRTPMAFVWVTIALPRLLVLWPCLTKSFSRLIVGWTWMTMGGHRCQWQCHG